MVVNIGIIGAGAIASNAFLPGFSKPDSELARRAMSDWDFNGSPNAAVVAIASRTHDKAKRLAAEFDIPRVYDDWRELVSDPKVNAVCVTTPNYLHAEMTVAACRAGKDVLVEKPLAMNLREAHEMVDAAREAGVVLMVHQNQRFFPVHEVAKEILEAGIIGRVLTLRARWSHSGPENWSPDGAWFFDPARAGHGALFDLGIHKFDVIRYLTAKEVSEVCAFTATLDKKIDVEDNGVAILRFDDGTLGVVEASWTSVPMENSVKLYGTKGILQVGTDSLHPISVMVEERPREFDLRLPPGAWHKNTYLPEVPKESATGGMFRHFIDCITTGRECIASGEDNLKSFEVALAAFESAATGRMLRLPLENSN